MSYRGRHREVNHHPRHAHRALVTLGMAGALAGLVAPVVATPVAADLGGPSLPPVHVDTVGTDELLAAVTRLVQGLYPLATGAVDYVVGEEVPRLAEEALDLAGIKIQGDNPVDDVTDLIEGIDMSGVVDQAVAHATALRATVEDIADGIPALDAELLLDDAENVVNYYTTGTVSPCASVSHDLIRLRSPEVSAPTTDDLPDSDSLGKVPVVVAGVVGVVFTLSDCVPDGGYVASDGGITVAGQVVARPFGDPEAGLLPGLVAPDGNGGPGPDVFNNVPNTEYCRVTYGGPYKDTGDASNLYVTARCYRPKYRDKFGDTVILWQSGTASIYERVNLQKFETHIAPHEAKAARFEDYAPQGQNEYEGTTPVTAGIEFGVEGKGVKATVGVSRSFGVSYTKFGGDLNSDGTTVFSTRGGYRHIAQGHRNTSRAFSQVAAWTFPSGVSNAFTVWYDQLAYKR